MITVPQSFFVNKDEVCISINNDWAFEFKTVIYYIF